MICRDNRKGGKTMFQRLGRIGMKIAQFMQSRNGFDKLSGFLLILVFVVNGVNSFVRDPRASLVMAIAAYALSGWALFRILSRNRLKRARENAKFGNIMKILGLQNAGTGIRETIKTTALRLQFISTHRFRRCPHCGETLRLSKKRGRRTFPCPKCGQEVKVWIVF